jgi:carbon storage regulator
MRDGIQTVVLLFKARRSKMLVLSRLEREQIKISRSILVTVIEIQRNKVRLGIEAPAEIGIVRNEISGRFPNCAVVPLEVCHDGTIVNTVTGETSELAPSIASAIRILLSI